jgi:hypothetical protein
MSGGKGNTRGRRRQNHHPAPHPFAQPIGRWSP